MDRTKVGLIFRRSNIVDVGGQLEVNLYVVRNGGVRALVAQFCRWRWSHGIVVTVVFQLHKI
jgi:hypothetical protein